MEARVSATSSKSPMIQAPARRLVVEIHRARMLPVSDPEFDVHRKRSTTEPATKPALRSPNTSRGPTLPQQHELTTTRWSSLQRVNSREVFTWHPVALRRLLVTGLRLCRQAGATRRQTGASESVRSISRTKPARSGLLLHPWSRSCTFRATPVLATPALPARAPPRRMRLRVPAVAHPLTEHATSASPIAPSRSFGHVVVPWSVPRHGDRTNRAVKLSP